ncbi:MAG: hypothetical protein WC613_04010 [Candidatus Aenigmatarchaeota archaeon]
MNDSRLTCNRCTKELTKVVVYSGAGKDFCCSIGCAYNANGDHKYTPMPKFTTL